jgi:hypothetical protein
VVRRSSYVSTGTFSSWESSAAKALLRLACSPSSPDRLVGKPTITRSAPCSATSSAIAAGSGGSTAGSGRASVPVGSEIAQPQRAVP